MCGETTFGNLHINEFNIQAKLKHGHAAHHIVLSSVKPAHSYSQK